MHKMYTVYIQRARQSLSLSHTHREGGRRRAGATEIKCEVDEGESKPELTASLTSSLPSSRPVATPTCLTNCTDRQAIICYMARNYIWRTCLKDRAEKMVIIHSWPAAMHLEASKRRLKWRKGASAWMGRRGKVSQD